MVTRSCGARSVIPELSHALEVEAVVRTRRCRSSRTRLMVTRSCGARSVIPELSHALEDGLWCTLGDAGAVARAYCCYGRRTRSVELLCAPIVVAVVRAWWSCCAHTLLTIDRPSYGPAWGSAWYPGEAPGEACGSWLNGISFPFLTFLGGCTLSPMSVVFPTGVFTRLRV